ncbi:hypothetical protein ABFS82_14G139500 [Erythranthe guttata]
MAYILPSTFVEPKLCFLSRRPNGRHSVHKLRCRAKNQSSNSPVNDDVSESENVLLKIAWYGSEFLGVAASFLRSPAKFGDAGASTELSVDVSGKIDRAAVVETIKEDFQRSYFVTGKNLVVFDV